MEDFQSQIDKIKFQVSLIGESLDSMKHPIASLVISMGWDELCLNIAHDIFEKYERLIDSGEKPNWTEFEFEFDEKLGVGYQRLKSIVLAFYRSDRWMHVCELYAKEKECMEFHEIIEG